MRGDIQPGSLVKNEQLMESAADGGSEIDAEVAFKHVVKTLDDVMRTPAARASNIAYVATCAFWHSLIGVDRNGKPTTKVLGWADTRSGSYTSALRKRFDERELHNSTGARFHSSYWPAKLLWIRNEHPDAFSRTDAWLSFSDFVALRLFGVAATSISMASGTGLMDVRTCKWNAALVRFLGLNAGSLALISEGAYSYRLVQKFQRRWPRLRSAEWFPAIGDGAANNLGSGCIKSSRAALMIGTSGAMRVAYAGEPPTTLPTGLWCYRIDRARVVTGGALSDGGGLYRWLVDNLRIDDDAETAIGRREPDSHGLTFMPFLHGERSTGYNDTATGALTGIRATTTALDMLHAGLEAVAYRFAEILDQLNDMFRIREIVASGGAIRSSPVWAQIIADVLGKELLMSDAEEASMRGAVLLALETVGAIPEIPAEHQSSTTIKPNRDRTRVYRAARKRHDEMYRLLFPR